MIKKLKNGFKYIEIKNKIASAKIALQGAHIYEYKCDGDKEILWLSPTSYLENGKAIRGGIPICWPRFGILDKEMPAHGFTRTAAFELVCINEINETTTEVILRLKDTKESRVIWDYKFELDIKFIISDTLSVKMISKNLDIKEFKITQALHTYFAVSHIDDVCINGLQDKVYIDTLIDKKLVQKGSIQIDSECDRVYFDVNKELDLVDKEKKISIKAVGSASAVVWNPWIEKGSSMAGMKVDAYKEFVCIETANAFDDFRVIQAGEGHTLAVTLSVS
ncbi:Aldose 1-epimerase [hydrothermal vent metagenome]|uniref:glucose-6-phosphate 1-epimerase n=1 Tax=hydrothermal vent metagenome TaxID=652676 RepID=A0A1W1BBV7_9ZZZZ